MRRTILLLLCTGYVGCSGAVDQNAHLTGLLDRAAFGDAHVTASSDDGLTADATRSASDGSFSLELSPGHVWAVQVVGADGGVVTPLAVPRIGHFDRGFDVEGGPVEALGLVRPGTGLPTLSLVPQAQSAQCVEGKEADGTPCAVLEALEACPDGPTRPMDDPSTLLLGTGQLADLPGSSRGIGYAVPSLVPVPIFWSCNLTPTPPT